jgi:hypothetical protein
MLADNNISVRAAGRDEPALAPRNESVANPLVDVDTPDKDPGAQLPPGRPREIDHQRSKKHDGGDEQRPSSP